MMKKREVTPEDNGEGHNDDHVGKTDFTSEFEDFHTLQECLERVQSDLAAPEENERVLQDTLKEVVKDCLGVAQDLANGHQMDMKRGPTRSEKGKRRYSLRPRAATSYHEQALSGTAKTVKVKKEKPTTTTRRTANDRNAVPKRTHNLRSRVMEDHAWPPDGSETDEVDEDGGTTVSDMEEEVAESDVTAESDEPDWSPNNASFHTSSASLRQIVASLKEWRENDPAPSLCNPIVLPPISEDFTPEPVLPRAMDIQMTPGQPNGPDAMRVDASSAATKVYVMPSGYIVQSVQLVLERKEAERTTSTTSFLSPMFRPVSYVHAFSGDYVPLRESLTVAESSLFLEMSSRLNMILTSPCTELLNLDQCGVGMDVTSFLSRMDEKWEKCYPIFQLPSLEQSDAQLEKNVKELLADLHGGNWNASEWGDGSNSGEMPVADACDSLIGVEKRLKDFSQQMEKFPEVLS